MLSGKLRGKERERESERIPSSVAGKIRFIYDKWYVRFTLHVAYWCK